MIFLAFVGSSLAADPSSADDCMGTSDLVAGRAKVPPDALVFAGGSYKTIENLANLGVYSIGRKIPEVAGGKAITLAQLTVDKIFVAEVLQGNKAFQGRYVTFLGVNECEEYGCLRAERNLREVKEDLDRVKPMAPSQAQIGLAPSGRARAPYMLYVLKRYTSDGDIEFGKADGILKYLVNKLGLQYYEDMCAWFPVRGVDEDDAVHAAFHSLN
jgi:hypothetical protein